MNSRGWRRPCSGTIVRMLLLFASLAVLRTLGIAEPPFSIVGGIILSDRAADEPFPPFRRGEWVLRRIAPACTFGPSLAGWAMYLIRDVFRCKPGQSRAVAEKFKATIPFVEEHDGFRNSRVLVDYVADYWTVVLEAEVEDLGQFDHHMASYSTHPGVREAMTGYLDLVQGGHREIFRIL